VFCHGSIRVASQNTCKSCEHFTLKAAFLPNLIQNFKLEFTNSFAPIIILTTSAETNNVMAGSSFAEIQQASDRCLCPKRCQKKPSHGDFWRFTSINQWVFVNFKILSCLLDFIWPPDFMKFDRTFLTVVRSLSIIFNYFMFLLCGFKILSCYYICKIKLLTQSARLESFYGHDIYRNVFPLT